jgi:hypothetical protein
MSKLDDYILKKQQMVLSEDWASMIGKRDIPDNWAGRIGNVSSVKLNEITIEYFKNNKPYHRGPEGLLPFLEESIKNMFPEIIKIALELQKEDLKSVAISALKENEQVIEELKILEN